MDAPAHVGCLIDVRLVGVISAEQIEDGKKETNDRLLGVAIHSYDHEDIATIDDVSKTLLSQIEEFFVGFVAKINGHRECVKRAITRRCRTTCR